MILIGVTSADEIPVQQLDHRPVGSDARAPARRDTHG
jgi:hypothetical protein